MTAFADLGLSESTLQALQDVGYEKPSPIQEQAIPPLLAGGDIIGQAQTGSGKTAAFGLPIVEHVDPTENDVQALVLTPTRELCIQVTQALRTYGARKRVDVVASDPIARRPPPLPPRGREGEVAVPDRRHRRAVQPADEVEREGRHAGRRARLGAARPGHRLHADEDPRRPALPQAARQG